MSPQTELHQGLLVAGTFGTRLLDQWRKPSSSVLVPKVPGWCSGKASGRCSDRLRPAPWLGSRPRAGMLSVRGCKHRFPREMKEHMSESKSTLAFPEPHSPLRFCLPPHPPLPLRRSLSLCPLLLPVFPGLDHRLRFSVLQQIPDRTCVSRCRT